MQSQVTGVFEKFPGGSYIVEKLGLDKLQSNLSNAFMDGLGTFSSALQTNLAAGMSQGQAFTSALTAGFGAVKGSIMAMMSPFAIFAAAVGGLLYILMDNNKQAKELAENMGVSKLQAKALMRNASEAAGSMNTMYATMDDILDVQKAFNDEMGNGLIISAEQAAATADIGIAFGYGADEAGLIPGDVIIEFDKKEIKFSSDLPHVVGQIKPETKAFAKIIRDGEEMTLEFKLGELPVNKESFIPAKTQSSSDPIGLKVADIDRDNPSMANMPDGVIVSRVNPNSPASGKVNRGDVITMIQYKGKKYEVIDVNSFNDALDNFSSGNKIAIHLIRSGNRLIRSITLN